ncbi:MAG: ligase-associated DNA damage response exonuclease [Rhodospirillales bacterium]
MSLSPSASHPDTWLKVTDAGLYCEPCDCFIDPHKPVARAVVTHGHADHARAGHDALLATPETLAIVKARYGEGAAQGFQPLAYGERLRLGDVTLWLAPAGHILGSAQVAIEWQGRRAVISGDYKRRADPTCAPFELVPCDLYVTEATFGLPVFRHPPAEAEVARLLQSLGVFPERTHLVGAYALGKAQRLVRLLRLAGYERPIYLHGAMLALMRLYVELGVDLGPLEPVGHLKGDQLAGEIVVAPPSAIADRWSRRFSNPVTAVASGWMRVRARARQSRAELPLVISDHADWDELLATLRDVEASQVWVTHGNEEALCHAAAGLGVDARALSLIGRGEAEQEAAPVA